MVALAQGETVDVDNPRLVFIHQLLGKLVDPVSVSFEIFRKVTDAERVAPVSVAGPTVVNLVTDKIGTGRFAATWAVPAAQRVGLYEIRWSFVSEAAGATEVARIEFEVLAGIGALLGPSYALVSEMRDEGINKNISDARIQVAIVIASRFVEQVTNRFFDARFQTLYVNGTGSNSVLLGDPVIAVESIRIETEPSLQPDLDVDATLYRVFNRHLGQGMLNPDDRESPKIEFVHSDDLLGVGSARFVPLSGVSIRSLTFPVGVQNTKIVGVFGYTEDTHNGSPWGDTPTLIRHVTKLLAIRNLPTLKSQCRDDNERWRIIETKVRDQSIKMAQPLKWGRYTGDPEIDQILVMFMRPPALGAA